MKAITTFRCEICVESFESAEKCKICEDSHVRPESIIEHPESYSTWEAYPGVIGIKFQDGTVINYVRDNDEMRVNYGK